MSCYPYCETSIRREDLLRELSDCVGLSDAFLPSPLCGGFDTKRLLILNREYKVGNLFFFDEKFIIIEDLVDIEKSSIIYCFNDNCNAALINHDGPVEVLDSINFYIKK